MPGERDLCCIRAITSILKLNYIGLKLHSFHIIILHLWGIYGPVKLSQFAHHPCLAVVLFQNQYENTVLKNIALPDVHKAV